MSAHTPGPWLVCGNDRNGHYDFVLPMAKNEDFQANCNLIKAAPDMLAALELCSDILFRITDILEMSGDEMNRSLARSAMIEANSATRKAKGEA